MSERKVLNKYFPPNFDPSKIPRRKKPLDVKDKRHKVRLMAPFSMQCETCREYIYKGKKFNAIKETVKGEMYLSIKIFRFYIRCPKCHAEITFKTDPANLDYVAERGAVRNYDPRRDEVAVTKIQEEEKEVEEELDPLRALENRTIESKREMEIMDALEEVRTRNARVERVDVDGLLDRLAAGGYAEGLDRSAEEEEAELDRLAREAFQGGDVAVTDASPWSKLRMATMWSDDEDDNQGDGNHDNDEEEQGDSAQRKGRVPRTSDDDGDAHAEEEEEEDLNALLLQYRLASSSSSASPGTATSTTKAKKRLHYAVAAADEDTPTNVDSLASNSGGSNEWASLAKRVKTSASSSSFTEAKFGIKPAANKGKSELIVKKAPPAAATAKPVAAVPSLLGLGYDDDDDDD